MDKMQTMKKFFIPPQSHNTNEVAKQDMSLECKCVRLEVLRCHYIKVVKHLTEDLSDNLSLLP